jgi:hypothetical protein
MAEEISFSLNRIPEPPKDAAPVQKKAPPVQEASRFNMAYYDLVRADKALSGCHDLLMNDAPAAAFRAMKHAVIILRHALIAPDRDKLGRMMKLLRTKLENLRRQPVVSKEEDAEFADDVEEALDFLYEAKQRAGLGIPKEIVRGIEARLREGMKG